MESKENNRREFIKKSAFLAAAGVAAGLSANSLFASENDAGEKFTLPNLPYDPSALEPHIDKTTMEIHHGKHHLAYVNNLNKALEGNADAGLPLEDIIKKISTFSTGVRNNAGGHYNHSLFWK